MFPPHTRYFSHIRGRDSMRGNDSKRLEYEIRSFLRRHARVITMHIPLVDYKQTPLRTTIQVRNYNGRVKYSYSNRKLPFELVKDIERFDSFVQVRFCTVDKPQTRLNAPPIFDNVYLTFEQAVKEAKTVAGIEEITCPGSHDETLVYRESDKNVNLIELIGKTSTLVCLGRNLLYPKYI